jgi:hypothetical protein
MGGHRKNGPEIRDSRHDAGGERDVVEAREPKRKEVAVKCVDARVKFNAIIVCTLLRVVE